jgi:glycosyltransferase involved in cell wall biosynthesis
MVKVLVIIPAFNEEGHIAEVVGRIRDAAPHAAVLVVNDGSSDRTARVAEKAGATVVSHPFNMGYGVTIQTGYKYALAKGYDFLVQIDGDGQHEPEFIPALLAPVVAGDADFALGSRFLGVQSYAPTLARRLGMGFFRGLLRVATGLYVSDCTSGFQAFNRKVLDAFCRDTFPVDYPDADVLITLHKCGLRMCEIPVKMYAPEGKSMHSGIKPVYYMFKMILSVFVTMLRSPNIYKGGR